MMEKPARGYVTKKSPFFRIAHIFCFLFVVLPISQAIEIEFLGAENLKISEKPNYLNVCHRNDKNLDFCIKSSLQKFMKSLNSGSGESFLPSIDPIQIPLLEIRKGSENVTLDLVLKNLKIYGFNNFNVTTVKSNIEDNKFEISLKAPYINMVAQYSAEGGIFTFPISAQGEFLYNLTDVSSVLIIHLGSKNDSLGYSYLTVENCLMTIFSSDISAHFGKSIDGSNQIASAFNEYFNSNAQEIFELIKPEVFDTFSKIAKAIAEEILSRHPEKNLLPD